MSDLGRWLRYAAPGSLALALFGFWLFMDNSRCPQKCELEGSFDVSVGIGLLSAGAVVPVGFVISVFAAQMVWRPPWLQGLPRWVRLWVFPLPDQDIAQKCWRQLVNLVPLAGRDIEAEAPRLTRAEASVFINMALQRIKEREGFRASVERVESLIDLNNGLANGSTACVVGALTVACAAARTGGFEAERWPAAVFVLVLSTVLWVFIWVGQRRVMGIVAIWLPTLLASVQISKPDE